MKKLNALIWFFALCICLPLQGQNKTLAKANKFYKAQDYHAAIPLYEEGLLEDDNLVAKTKLANAYKKINQLDKAEKLYAALVYDDKVKVYTFKSYGETLMGNGKYAAAKFWFEEYLKEKPGDASVVQNLASCNKVYNIKPLFYDVVIEPFPFNSAFDDNGAVMLGDKIIFSSDRPSGLKLLKQKVSDDGREFINIYESSRGGENFTEPANYESKFNLLNKNVGPITFNAAGDFAIFSRNADVANKSDEYPMQLYSAEFDGKKWKNIVPLNFCKPGNNYMHPALSPDGKRLYFATDKAGGEGKTDLYVSYKKAAAWSLPQNLGPEINTAESEGFPFVSNDGKLYFCSKGRLGFGGFDIYAATQIETTSNWNTPVNLGFPMNSSADDISFFINEEQNAGVISSSRNNQGDDLFTFYIKEETVEEVEEAVTFEAQPEKEPMDIAKIEEEIKAIDTPATEAEEILAPVEDVVALETVVEPSAPQVIEVSEKIEPVVEKVEPEQEKVMNVLNKKSDEAIVQEVKSDTILLDKDQMGQLNNPTTVVTNEAVLTSANSNPVDLVEVSTSGAMGNADVTPEPAPQPAIPSATVKEMIVEQEEIIPTEEVIPEEIVEEEIQVETIKEMPAEVIKTVEEEVIAEVPTPKVEKKKKKKKDKKKSAENKKEEVITEVTKVEAEEKPVMEKMDVPEIAEVAPTMEKEVFKAGTPLAIADLSKDLELGKKDNKYALGDLKYAFNATEITAELGAALDALVPLLENNPEVKLEFIGHTGSIGSDQKNHRLSVARAAAAVDYLIGLGVGPDRISYAGKGETELLNGCTDGILCGKAQHQENERIEIKVLQ